MYLNIVGRSKLLEFRTDLHPCTNVVILGRNDQIMSDAGRSVEVSPFTPDYESTNQVSMMDAVSRYDNKRTLERFTIKVRDAISAPTVDHNVSHYM